MADDESTQTINHADIKELVRRAIKNDDAEALRALLDRHPKAKGRIADPATDTGADLLRRVRSPAMLDVLLDAGVDVNARTHWWAGGFGLLDGASPELAAYAVQRGATLTPHAAARLGWLDDLRRMVEADPTVVHARGGDGQTPLHFASTVEVADLLLDHGADIDARDVDHMSTPAQYMVRSRQDVARHLVKRGCKTDVLMATALGDSDLVNRHLDADPECIRMRVSDEYFPMVAPKQGGAIYQWELGWYVSACQVARSFSHTAIFDVLWDACPPEERLLNACWLRDETIVRDLLSADPALADRLPPAGRRQLAHAARNDDTEAARLMLAAGLPVQEYSQHHASTLHWAAWHGNVELVRLILERQPDLENADNDFNGTPLGWAIHGSENSWHPGRGDHAAVVEALLAAGAKRPEKIEGSPAVQEVLRR